jgi:hypothetical protein
VCLQVCLFYHRGGCDIEFPGFINSSYESQSPTADQERTVNMYFEPMESQGATARYALYPTPGVEEIGEAGVAPGRAHFFENGREFAVEGTTFYEISEAGTFTSRGTVAIGSNPATISSNGDGGGQLFITSGDNGYSFDLSTNTLSQVAALNGLATMGDHIDGYFLALDAATSTFYISALLDGTSWTTGTDFAQRSIASDPWKSMKVNGRYIWLLGEHTSEPWYNTGAASFPFAPYPSLLIPYGIVAPFSVAVGDGTITWLGASRRGDRYVLSASGLQPEIVSDYPRQYIFSLYGTADDAQAEVFNYLGHPFYRLTFPTEDITWVWDGRTNKWSEWNTWVSEDSEFVASRARWHAMAFGEHRWLDSDTGAVYRMASDLTEDVDGREIRRVRRAPGLSYENRMLFYPGFELLLEPGLGLSSGQGSDPQVMIRMSRDGGKTWGNEHTVSAGAIGEYGKRVRLNRCGAARQMVFEVSFSDPIAWRLVNAYLTPDPIGVPQQRRSA